MGRSPVESRSLAPEFAHAVRHFKTVAAAGGHKNAAHFPVDCPAVMSGAKAYFSGCPLSWVSMPTFVVLCLDLLNKSACEERRSGEKGARSRPDSGRHRGTGVTVDSPHVSRPSPRTTRVLGTPEKREALRLRSGWAMGHPELSRPGTWGTRHER